MRYRVRRPDLGLLAIGVPVDVFADEDVACLHPLYTRLRLIGDHEPLDGDPGAWLTDWLLEWDMLIDHNLRVPEPRRARFAAVLEHIEPFIGAVFTTADLLRMGETSDG